MENIVEDKTIIERVKIKIKTKEISLILILVFEIVVVSFFSDRFLTTYNFLNMTTHFIERGIIALGMTLIIISGGIDLSVGSITGMVAMVIGVLWNNLEFPLPVACLIGVIVGTLAGSLNGIIISRVKVPPLIITLGTMSMFRGLAYSISKANTISGFPQEFYYIGQGKIGNTQIPFQLVIFIILIIIFYQILKKTAYGRKIYVLGNNETCAIYSGVNISKVKISLYLISGLLCSIAAIIMTSRVATTRADFATGFELDVITAVLIGGTYINGGEGGILSTVLGIAIMMIMANAITLIGFSSTVNMILTGFILIVAVFCRTKIK